MPFRGGNEGVPLQEGSFGLARCLDGAASTGEGGVTRGGDTGIGGRVMVDAGVELVISWVICCS